MPPSKDHPPTPDRPREDSSAADRDNPALEGAATAGDQPATVVFTLDYDRELTYLEREGRIRGRRRPTGFKT